MKIKTRLFRRMAEMNKKVKVFVGILALLAIGGGVYGFVRATTADGATVTVSTSGSYSYGYTDLTTPAGRYSTSLFTVSSGGASYGAMCLEPRLVTTTGAATTSQISNTSTLGKQMIRVMLVTDNRHNAAIYNEFNSAYPNIWYNLSSAAIQYGPDPSVAPYVLGHVIVGKLFDSEYSDYFAMESYRTQLDAALNTINSWFNTNYPNEHKSWNVYSATSTASDAWNRQRIGWIEPLMAQIRVKKVDEDNNVMTGTSGVTFDVLYAVDSSSPLIYYGATVSLKTNGYSDWLTVPAGYVYCFDESQGIDGYEPAEEFVCTSGTVAAGGKATVTFKNKKIEEVKGGVKIYKIDADTGTATPQGAASLAGAYFGIWSGNTCGTSTSDANYVRRIKVNSSGVASTSGTLDVGTYCIAELSAGTGYVMPTGSARKTKTFEVTSASVVTLQEPFENTVIKGGVTLTKKKKIGGTTSNFQGVKFKITSNSDPNFAAVTITSQSNGVAQTSTKALPYGNYTITEVCDSVVAGFSCGYSETFSITTNGTRVTLKGNTSAQDGTVLNTANEPAISTKASACDSSSSSLPISGATCVKDVVTLKSNFTTGTEYKITAVLKDGTTAIKTKNDTWTQASGTTSRTIQFDTFDSSDYANKTLYVMATVYMCSNGTGCISSGSGWTEVKVFNSDNSDSDERVTIGGYKIDTTAAGKSGSVTSDGKLLAGNVTITDTITVSGLTNGTTYQIDGYVTDGSCGDSANKIVTKTDNYTMSAATGTQVSTTMEFNLDASKYIGKTLTVCETVKKGGTVVIAHNGGSTQQVTVGTPSIATSAKNKEDDSRTLAIGDVQVIDYVTYSGLKPGDTYNLKASIYKTDDLTTPITTAASSFTASTASGTTSASESPVFDFSTGALANKTLVVYEELYKGDQKIAEHKVATDAAQQVRVSEVDIRTIAMSAVDGNTKAFNVGGDITVRDTVKLKGLVKGTSYKIKGWLVDTNGTKVNIKNGTNNEIVKDYTMTAETGTQVTDTMDFVLDSVAFIGKQLIVFEQLLDANGTAIASHTQLTDSEQKITITTPEIGTTVNPKSLYVGDNTLTDTVSYNNLVSGQTYTLIGKLMKVNSDGGVTPVKNNNVAIEKTQEVTVPAGRTGGTFTMTFEVNTIEYQGADLVVYEYLKYGDTEIAKHENATTGSANSQWTKVKVANIGTKAKDGNDTDNIIEPEKNQKISDTVSYSGLQPGQTYTMSGKIMRKDNGEPLKINGTEITAKKTFTASATGNGEVEMSFTLDATELPGVSLVVFEQLYIGAEVSGEPLLKHEDLTDPEQLVVVRPRIGTTAADKLDGDQEVGVGNVTVQDTIKYEGLTVGERYIAVGTLVDKQTGEVLEVITRCKTEESEDGSEEDGSTDGSTGSSTDGGSSDGDTSDEGGESEDTEEEDCVVPERKITSQVEFVVTGEGTAVIADGTVTPLLEFYLSTRDLVGKEVVVFEEVYKAQGYTPGTSEPVTVHKDLEDESQLIIVSDPEIGTTAVDKIDGDKEVDNNGTVVIEDTVEYKGLVPGTKYILHGSLRDKENGEALTLLDSTVEGNKANGKKAKLSEDNKELILEVTADRTDGKFYMNFEISADGLAGKELVVFEALYIETITEDGEEYVFGEKELVEHHDLTSEAQTVHVKVNPPDTGAVAKDGGAAKAVRVVLALTFVAFGGALGGYFGMRMYKKRKMSL